MAGTLGSLAPHLAFFALLLAATLTYFGLVESVKQRLDRRYTVQHSTHARLSLLLKRLL